MSWPDHLGTQHGNRQSRVSRLLIRDDAGIAISSTEYLAHPQTGLVVRDKDICLLRSTSTYYLLAIDSVIRNKQRQHVAL